MKNNFCTLFDQNYLTRGLALYQSLLRHGDDFQLWILCMDNETYTILNKLQLEKVSLIKLSDIEDEALLKIKPTRTAVEYCWTLTPSLPLYILKNHPELSDIAYLDADTFFYSSTQPLYDEFINYDALIVKHNFAPEFEHKEKESGTYNVELLIFRNNANGQQILQWWRERCIEWCFFRYEDGKLGDQLYLNDWPERFSKVRVLHHRGGGVAPWNVDQYQMQKKKGGLFINDQPVIFYHFHAFRWYHETRLHGLPMYEPAENYWLSWTTKHYIYQPYLHTLRFSIKLIRSVQSDFNKGFHDHPTRTSSQWLVYGINMLRAHQFALYLLASSIFLFLLNQWLWPTSDEFFYGIQAKSFQAASQGLMRWSDINTEHVGLVSFLSFIWNIIFHPNTLAASRMVIFSYSLGIMALLYGIGKAAGLENKYRMWPIWLLLLIPGFWIFSVRLMLDIPATFGVALIVYLLIKRAPSYQIGLALLLVLLLKEYYIYLMFLLVFCMLIFDTFFIAKHKKTSQKILFFIKDIFLIILPSLIAIVLFLDFNILPYPRLLENSLLFVLGDIFIAINKGILLLLGQTSNLVTTTAPFPEIISSPTVIEPNIITDGAVVETVTTTVTNPPPIPELINAAADLQLTGTIGEGIIKSTANYPVQNFFTRWWWIYKYNLSDVDVTLLMLPLAVIGIGLRGKNLISYFQNQYMKVRADIIMFILLILFLYFNYHEADNKHGFRITIPIIIALIYFATFGLRSLTEKIQLRQTLAFGLLTAGLLLAYGISIQDIIYGSVLANESFFNFLFVYKNYVFMVGYAVMAFCFIFSQRLNLCGNIGYY